VTDAALGVRVNLHLINIFHFDLSFHPKECLADSKFSDEKKVPNDLDSSTFLRHVQHESRRNNHIQTSPLPHLISIDLDVPHLVSTAGPEPSKYPSRNSLVPSRHPTLSLKPPTLLCDLRLGTRRTWDGRWNVEVINWDDRDKLGLAVIVVEFLGL